MTVHQQRRKRYQRQIIAARLLFFVASAAFAGAGAAAMDAGRVAGGAGHFGVTLLLLCLWLETPAMVAGSLARDEEWARREKRKLLERPAALLVLGRVGWGLLLVSVILQLALGVS